MAALNLAFLKTRLFWLKLHRYLALSVALGLLLVGVSGSLSVYRETIDTWFNPQLVAKANGKPLSLDKIIAAVKQAQPARYGTWTLELPTRADGMITAWYDKPHETFFERYAPLMISVNPYTAQVTSSRFWGQTLSTWILDIHTQLAAGDLGWQLVGSLSVALLVLLGSGTYLWLSGCAAWHSNFTMRYRARYTVFLADIHRWAGILGVLPLLVLAFTGLQLSYPALLTTLTGASGMEHGATGRSIVSTAEPHKHPTTLAGAVFIARSYFPDAELRRVTTPLGETGVYRINFRQAAEINRRHPFTTVWVDQWSGQVKAIRDPLGFSAGEILVSWLWPLHTGEALGTWGRCFWFLAGIQLSLLSITGMWLWLLRRGILVDKPVDWHLFEQWHLSLTTLIQRALKVVVRISLIWLRYLAALPWQQWRIFWQARLKQAYFVVWQRFCNKIRR